MYIHHREDRQREREHGLVPRATPRPERVSIFKNDAMKITPHHDLYK